MSAASPLTNTGSNSAHHPQALLLVLHAASQRLLHWQANPQSWNQLLLQVFRRSAPIDLSGIPIEIRDGDTMAVLHGAYAPVSPNGAERIYLNADWLSSATPAAIEVVLLEELGHAIDHRLNQGNDTSGDEGVIFSALIRGIPIPAVETTQSDHHTLIINGQSIAVEAAAPIASGSPSLTSVAEDGTDLAAVTVANLFSSSFFDTDGDTLQGVVVTSNAADSDAEGSWQYSTDSGWQTIAKAHDLGWESIFGDLIQPDRVVEDLFA